MPETPSTQPDDRAAAPRPRARLRPPRGIVLSVLVTSTLAAAACGGRATGGSDVATDAEWRALRAPRPEPLPAAPRVAVGEVQILGSAPRVHGGVSTPLAVAELVSAGLLRRRDVTFVERRRFAAAVEAERAGRRPPGQPPAGVSRSADFQLVAVWIPAAAGAAVDVRLVRLEDGEVVRAGRRALAADGGPVRLARGIVAEGIGVLDALGRRPAWDDPLGDANYLASDGVGPDALERFLDGLAAEELWRWEEARRGYQAAAADASFFEARAALARTARLRLGGTLAES